MYHSLWCYAYILSSVVVAVSPQILPGDVLPDYSIKTLDGKYVITSEQPNKILVVQAYDPEDAFCTYMWRSQPSLSSFQDSPPSTTYLFISHSGNATEQALMMRARLKPSSSPKTGAALPVEFQFATQSTEELEGWVPQLFSEWTTPRKRMHAEIISAPSAETAALMRSSSPAALADSTLKAPTLNKVESTRLDAAYEWIPWPMTGVTGQLVYAGHALSSTNLPALNGSVAFIPLARYPCHHNEYLMNSNRNSRSSIESDDCYGMSYAEMLLEVQKAGAIACLFAAPQGEEIEQINCNPGLSSSFQHLQHSKIMNIQEDCSTAIQIPATMIPYAAGAQLSEALTQKGKLLLPSAAIFVNFTETDDSWGLNFGIDSHGRLFEVGWLKFPTLKHAIWAAQWEAYVNNLEASLSSTSLLHVPIFHEEIMQGEHGVRISASIPTFTTLTKYDTAVLDMTLDCLGPRDADCPAWDHMIQLFVCCGTGKGQEEGNLPQSCDICPATVWKPRTYNNNTNTNSSNNNNLEEEKLLCGRELGRWATPFRRRGGRWLTDITSLMPLLTEASRTPSTYDASSSFSSSAGYNGGEGSLEQQCMFTMQSTAWSGSWKPSLSLWFNDSKSMRTHQIMKTKSQVLSLPFNGGTFDVNYNSLHEPFVFDALEVGVLKKAEIVAYITGHGMNDEFGCAEFCPTSHHFLVNGQRHSTEYTEAGTLWGCAEKVAVGVLPNEHGTWQYGRNGWCDGQAVQPWVIDITQDLTLEGSNTIEYYGLFQGKDPDPQENAGYIMMQSNLIILYVDTQEDHFYKMAL